MEGELIEELRRLSSKIDRLLAETRPAYITQPQLLNLSLPKRSQQFTSPKAIYEFVRKALQDLPQEHAVVLCLNTRLCVSHVEVISKGTANSAMLHPRDIFRVAVQHNASAIVLVHCHPSGDPTPSKEDLRATENLYRASRLLDIPLIDHLVIGDGCYLSLKEHSPNLFR